MKQTEKVIIAAWLLSKGADVKSTADFVVALSQGLENKEEDSIAWHQSVMHRIAVEEIPGEYGEFIRVVQATDSLEAATARLERALGGFSEAKQILEAEPKSELAARILVRQALAAISNGLGKETFEEAR